MSELDDVVKENQRRCFPNSRSGKQEQKLLEKYPGLPESQNREKEALIAFYATQEDEPFLSSSLKKIASCPPETSFGLPQQPSNRERRKEGGLVTSVSPSLKPFNPSGDLMFDMDEEDAIPLTGPWDKNGKDIYPSPSSNLSKLDEGTWFNAKGKAIVFSSPSVQDMSPKSSLKKQLSAPGWASAESWRPPVPEKLPMKEIMAQTSSSLGKSNISLELSATPEKVSQKERKRQQQQTAGPSAAPIISIPEKQVPRMWAIPATVSRVSLKKVLMESSSLPAVSEKTRTLRSASVRGDIQGVFSTPPSPTPRPAAAQRRTVSAASTSSHLPPPVSRRSEATLHLSLADIMSQEEVHKEIMRDHTAKRSLQEIQAEQEFLRWWDIESEKVRLETAAAGMVASRGSGRRRGDGSGKRGGRGRGFGGGGGGRRGRGEPVTTGQGGRD